MSAPMGRCACGGVLHMAEGGSVDDDLTKPSFRKPLIAKRREDRQDRKGSADAPLSVARGAVAGALGLPGDIEKLGRAIWNTKPSSRQSKGVTLPDVDSLPFFRTSEDFNESLPLRARESRSRSAMEGLGNLVAPGPPLAAGEKVGKAFVSGGEALAQAAEKAAAHADPAIGRFVNRTMEKGGIPADLLQSFATTPSRAVRAPGTQWGPFGKNPKEILNEYEAKQAQTLPPEVSTAFKAKVRNYIRDEMGTPTDPLRTKELTSDNVNYVRRDVNDVPISRKPILEKVDTSGKLHISQTELNRLNEVYGLSPRRIIDHLPVDYANNPQFNFGKNFKRSYDQDKNSLKLYDDARMSEPKARTGWENLADGSIDHINLRDLRDIVRGPLPERLHNLDYDTPLTYAVDNGDRMVNDLGFGNIRKYMKEATAEPRPADYVGPLTPEQKAFDSGAVERWSPQRIANMDISTLADNTGRMLADADRTRLRGKLNDTIHRRILENNDYHVSELHPNGLTYETEVMNNCVGDGCKYSDAVRRGNTKIFSVRDKKTGEPGVTIEANVSRPNKILDRLPEQHVADLWIEANKAGGEPHEIHNRYSKAYQDALDAKNRSEWTINQIRGKDQNAPIAEKYLPIVHDFLNNADKAGGIPQWKDIAQTEFDMYGLRDNTIKDASGKFWHPEEYDNALLQHGRVQLPGGTESYALPAYKDLFVKQEAKALADAGGKPTRYDQEEWETAAENSFKHYAGGKSTRTDVKGSVELPEGWREQWWTDRAAQQEAAKEAAKKAAAEEAKANMPVIPQQPQGPFAAVGQPLRGNFEQRLEEPDDYDFRAGGRVGYAVGGSIAAPSTVGLGTFAGDSNQGSTVGTSSGGGLGSPFGNAPMTQPVQQPQQSTAQFRPKDTSGSGYNQIFQTDFGGQLPTQTVQGAPSYDLNDPTGRALYGMTLGAGGAGADLTGTQAFMGAYNPGNATKQDQFGKYTYDTGELARMAKQVGYDTSGYNLGSDVNDTDFYKLYNDMNEKMKNYHYISGMSGGWNPTGDWRGADRTLYLDDGTGKLNPVTNPVDYHAREKGNWFAENPEFVAAASILAGGYFGGTALAGAGAGAGAGTGAASAGWGTTAANAVGLGSQWGAIPAAGQAAIQGAAQGALTSGITGGNPWTGALMGGVGGAGGYFGGQVGGYLSPELAGVGKQAGSMGAKYFANQARNS